MATPRCQLVDPDNPLCYHIVSRCVRRSWLCGYDPYTRKDYSHRKQWIIQRLKQLSKAFPVDIYSYAIMNNHFHLVLYYNPKAHLQWSDREVIQRWLIACPPKRPDGSVDQDLSAFLEESSLEQPERIQYCRKQLACLSNFMKFLKQYIAKRANLEDECTGHFFEQRFHSSALLSEYDVLAAMAYVDLNPIRAQITDTIENAEHTAIYQRLHAIDRVAALHAYLKPVIAGLKAQPPVRVTLANYIEHLQVLVPGATPTWPQHKLNRWRQQIALLGKPQRAYGPEEVLKAWVHARGWALRETPTP